MLDTCLQLSTSNPTQPSPTQPNPAQPNPTQPNPTQPNPTQPNPTQPHPNQPNATQPNPTYVLYCNCVCQNGWKSNVPADAYNLARFRFLGQTRRHRREIGFLARDKDKEHLFVQYHGKNIPLAYSHATFRYLLSSSISSLIASPAVSVSYSLRSKLERRDNPARSVYTPEFSSRLVTLYISSPILR